MFGYLRSQFKDAPPPLEVGRAYSFPWCPSAMHLCFDQGGTRWFMTSTSKYGYLTTASPGSPSLHYRKASRAEFIGGLKLKTITPRGAIGPRQLIYPPYWVGDVVHLVGAKSHRYKVVAIAGASALLEGPKGVYTAEPFEELDKLYRFWRKKERNT